MTYGYTGDIMNGKTTNRERGNLIIALSPMGHRNRANSLLGGEPIILTGGKHTNAHTERNPKQVRAERKRNRQLRKRSK